MVPIANVLAHCHQSYCKDVLVQYNICVNRRREIVTQKIVFEIKVNNVSKLL